MSKLFEQVKTKIYHLNGVNSEEVIKAEAKLGLHFNEEFRNYLMEYGVISFGSHELMGLGGDLHLDVVKETIREKNQNRRFPKNCYIVENIGIDGILILQNEEGVMFELTDAGLRKIFDTLKDYVKSIC